MKILYAPWRKSYSNGEKKEHIPAEECPFCIHLKQTTDEKNLILKRGKFCFIMLNLYPYNAGHVMVLPNRHVSDLTDLNAEEQDELMELTTEATRILKKGLNAQGINIGMNLGRAAGAGIPAHLHMHVIPRWEGDTNFLPVIGEVKQISFDMNDIYKKLKDLIK